MTSFSWSYISRDVHVVFVPYKRFVTMFYSCKFTDFDLLQKKTTKGYSKPTTQAARNQQQAANRGKNTKSPVKSEKTVKKVS